MNNEKREIIFYDLVKFVDVKVCVMIYFVFGDIKDDLRIGRKDFKGLVNRRGVSFVIFGNDGGYFDINNKKLDLFIGLIVVMRLFFKCFFCNG